MEEFNMETFLSIPDDEIELVNDIEETEDAPLEKEEQEDQEEIQSPPDTNLKDINPEEGKKESSNIYSSLLKGLVEEGILNETNAKEIKSFSDLTEVLNKEFDSRVEGRLKELTPDQQFFASKRKLGYDDEEILSQLNTKKAYETITDEMLEKEGEEGDKLRENIIRNYYKTKNFSEAKIDKLVARSIENGEDAEEAKEFFSEMKKNYEEQQKLADIQKQEDLKKQEESYNNTVRSLREFAVATKEIIPAIPISKKMKDEVVSGLINPVSKTEDGIPLDIIGDFYNKASVEDKFKLAYLIKLTSGLTNFDNLSIKKGKSKAIQEIDDALKIQDIKEFQNTSDDNFLDFLENVNVI